MAEGCLPGLSVNMELISLERISHKYQRAFAFRLKFPINWDKRDIAPYIPIEEQDLNIS